MAIPPPAACHFVTRHESRFVCRTVPNVKSAQRVPCGTRNHPRTLAAIVK